MNPPKFKVGDMVMFQADLPQDKMFSGRIGTITGLPVTWKNYAGETWRYPTDMPGRIPGTNAIPCEYCLRLIKDGDLKLDDIPLDVKEPA